MQAVDDFTIVRPLFAGAFAEALRQGEPTLCMAHVFTLDEPVSGKALSAAWEKTVQVYPYFSEAIVQKDGMYYLAENPLEFVIRETEEYIEPSTEAANYHTCGVYHGIIEGYKKALAAGMLGTVMQGRKNTPMTVAASYLGTLATGSYGARLHLEAFLILNQRDFCAYMLEIGKTFYLSLSFGAKTDRYARATAEIMQELGMFSACWREA